MSPRTLFTIILKIFGLSMIYGLIDTIPAWLRRLATAHSDSTSVILYIIWISLALTVYFLILWASLFRTNWIIDKLKLDKGFDQESVTIKIEGIDIIRIALIILGGMMLIIAIPNLFSDSVYFYKLKKETTEPISSFSGISLSKMWDSMNLSMTIFNGIRIIIGVILITLNKRLTNWISRMNIRNETPAEEENNLQ